MILIPFLIYLTFSTENPDFDDDDDQDIEIPEKDGRSQNYYSDDYDYPENDEPSENPEVDQYYEEYYRRRYEMMNRKCGPNTNKLEGYCQCNSEYPSGDPYSKNGCYKCSETCSKFANCAYSSPSKGRCECLNNYEGNGKVCWARAPQVNSVSYLPKGLINISVQFDSDIYVNHTDAQCKFEGTLSDAVDAGEGYVICQVPSWAKDYMTYLISVNGSWCEEAITYVDRDVSSNMPPEDDYISYFYFVALMLLVLIGLMNTKSVHPSQIEPFFTPPAWLKPYHDKLIEKFTRRVEKHE